jgi:hypothetical protein
MANLAEFLRAIAPTIATVLGGPLAGAAVSVLGDALGVSEPTQAKIEKILTNGQMTGDQLVAIKKADTEFVAKMKELDIDLEKVHAGDRGSARDMQKTTRANIPGLLAIAVTLGFFGILGGMMTGTLKTDANNDALLIMLGALGASWGAIVNFYFGSSRGSELKTEMMARNGTVK